MLAEVQLDCRKCSDAQKVERGCVEDSPIPGVWKIDDWEFSRCPLKIVKPQSFAYIRAFNFYKDGFLPTAGGWMKQPAKLIEAIGYIQGAIKRQEEERKKG